METTNNIGELYNLIEKNPTHATFVENLEIWIRFYNERELIIENNILNPNLFDIIKFLLQHEKGEISTKFHYDILSTVINKQIQLNKRIQKYYDENEISLETYIDNIFTNFDNYCKLSPLIKELNEKNDVDNNIEELINSLKIDIIINLIETLSNDFFDFEPSQTKEILKFITIMIFDLQFITKCPLNLILTLLEKYLQKILPIKMFVGVNISNDIIIKYLKENKIEAKKIILSLFCDTKLGLFLSVFKYDLNNVIKFLNEANYIGNVTKEALFFQLINKMLKEEDAIPILLNLIIKGNNSNFLSRNLWDSFYNKILIAAMNYTICNFDSEMIKFVLTAEYKETGIKDIKEKENYQLAKQKFIIDCRYLLINKEKKVNGDNFDTEGVKETLKLISPRIESFQDLTIYETDDINTKVNKTHQRFELGLKIDFDNAITLLENYFNDKIELTLPTIKSIIRSICLEIQQSLEIDGNGIYYYISNRDLGIFNSESLTITISDKTLMDLLNEQKSTYERIQAIIVIFHEITHSLIDQNKRRNIWNFEMYEMEKEDVIRQYDIFFYKENYAKFKEEIEAETKGIDYTMKFIETYLPNLLDKIQDDLIEELKIKRKFQNDPTIDIKNCFEIRAKDIHIIFDRLIQYNPHILDKHPIFKLEYYEEGLPKTKEDILSSMTEENRELINNIIKRRYPENTKSNSKPGYKK